MSKKRKDLILECINVEKKRKDLILECINVEPRIGFETSSQDRSIAVLASFFELFTGGEVSAEHRGCVARWREVGWPEHLEKNRVEARAWAILVMLSILCYKHARARTHTTTATLHIPSFSR
jgi:hypothetical protein